MCGGQFCAKLKIKSSFSSLFLSLYHIACTEAFFRWWQDYYRRQNNRVKPENLLPQLISAFDIVQNKVKKNKGTHIREIQAFQKNFQTVYDPLHPKRTVYYVARTLKDKILEKIPTMKFPPFTPSKYLFALHFKIKFPSLPTSEMALAFRPPYPTWFFCDSVLGMKQKLKMKEKDKVTATKCNLYTFRVTFISICLTFESFLQ